jgi:hypothetical protein
VPAKADLGHPTWNVFQNIVGILDEFANDLRPVYRWERSVEEERLEPPRALQRFERSAWFDKLTMSGSVFPLILSSTKLVSKD